MTQESLEKQLQEIQMQLDDIEKIDKENEEMMFKLYISITDVEGTIMMLNTSKHIDLTDPSLGKYALRILMRRINHIEAMQLLRLLFSAGADPNLLENFNYYGCHNFRLVELRDKMVVEAGLEDIKKLVRFDDYYRYRFFVWEYVEKSFMISFLIESITC